MTVYFEDLYSEDGEAVFAYILLRNSQAPEIIQKKLGDTRSERETKAFIIGFVEGVKTINLLLSNQGLDVKFELMKFDNDDDCSISFNDDDCSISFNEKHIDEPNLDQFNRS